jgi:hypothetical protein
MGTGASLTSAGVGLVAAGIAFILVRHNHKHGMSAFRGALFFSIIAGLCLSASAATYVGSLITTSIAGVGIVLIIVVLGGIELVCMMRGHGHHPLWTPVLGLLVALAVPLMPGAIGHLGQQTGAHVVNIVHAGNAKLGG